MTLGRQVRSLQNRQAGPVQAKYEYVDLSTVDNRPLLQNPIIFAINDFYEGAPVFRGHVTTAGDPEVTTVANWTKNTYDLDIQHSSDWLATLNQDTVSAVNYKALTTKLKIQITGRNVLDVEPFGLRVRVTFVRIKNPMTNTTTRKWSLPFYGGAYWYLCSDDVDRRNHFHPTYHDVLYDRFHTFQKEEFAGQATMIDDTIYKTIQIPFSFKGGPANISMDKTATPSGQSFYTNIPQSNQIFCIISTNIQTTPNLKFRIERQCVWRDPHGSIH